MFPRFALLSVMLISFSTGAAGQNAVRPIPPPGIAIPEEERKELEAGVSALDRTIEMLRTELRTPALRGELPNIRIFHKSVDWARRYNEIFDLKQVAIAKEQLAQGMLRAEALRKTNAERSGEESAKRSRLPWNSATGMVVRGYISRIDGSVQPYGLVIPDDWKPEDKTPRRLDFWMHGRGEKLSELAFLDDRTKNKGEFTPAGAFVLHLYGRYCCANKFAGEVDLFEALEDARKTYPIDRNRLVVRGFSMGGASTWQFATHYASEWAAAAPGAGFAETAEFFKVFAPGKEPPPWWEQTLWRWYDSTLYAANLANCPTVAYSGEIDGQKQAADIMIQYAEKEGVTIPHIIGPQTPHKYHPESKPKIEEFVTAAARKGRDPVPKKVHLTTYSLVYPRMAWIMITGLEKNWERADADGDLEGGQIALQTKNVSSIRIARSLLAPTAIQSVRIDGQTVPIASRGTEWDFTKDAGGKWGPDRGGARKGPALCGPIDHAFMDRFLMVRPTGKPLNETIGAWAQSELEHSVAFWRRVFRGDAPVKDDRAVNADDIAKSNLILWGDPSSNAVLGKILAKLPLQWTKDAIRFNGAKYDGAHHAPILIFPNPLNPQKYVVLNSGVTFREQALLNNSDQTPKLPDWAIVDLRTPPGPKWPGLVVDAGFFNEQWQLPERQQ